MNHPLLKPAKAKLSAREHQLERFVKHMRRILKALENSDSEIERMGNELERNISAGKNRKRNAQLHRNTGKSYTSRSNKIIPERKIKLLKDCRKKCNEKIAVEEQKKIFNKY